MCNGPSETRSILLVEDFDDARELYAICLRAAGYDVLEVSTGEEAIRLAREQTTDLILMDMALPGIDGWEATAILKGDERTRMIPVIALTAHALRDERERMAEIGCDGFLAKPCLPPDLIHAVDRILNVRQAAPAETA
jgi:CheY-like chemotaxis protein